MIVNVSTTKQHRASSPLQQHGSEVLFSIEDMIGSQLLERIAQGTARSRPAGIRRERRGYVPTLYSNRA